MAKKYYWEIEEPEYNEETGEPTGNIVTHNISLVCSRITGKAIVTIDARTFNISEKPFSLSGVEQMFRLGEMAALLSFPKKGAPTITVDGRIIAHK